MDDVTRFQKLDDACERLKDKRYGAVMVIVKRAEALAQAMKPADRWAKNAVPDDADRMKMVVDGDMLVMKGYRYIGDGYDDREYRMPLDYANGQRPDAQEWLDRMAKDGMDQANAAAAAAKARAERAEREQYDKLKAKFEGKS